MHFLNAPHESLDFNEVIAQLADVYQTGLGAPRDP